MVIKSFPPKTFYVREGLSSLLVVCTWFDCGNSYKVKRVGSRENRKVLVISRHRLVTFTILELQSLVNRIYSFIEVNRKRVFHFNSNKSGKNK